MVRKHSVLTGFIMLTALAMPAHADPVDLNASFDDAFGTDTRAPTTFEAIYEKTFEQQINELADASNGRIGVYAVDLSTGEDVSILADMRFPMA